MPEVIEEISCINCGAPLKFKPGELVVTCDYCGYTSVIKTGEAFVLEHSMLVNKLTAEQVTDLLHSWMGGGFLKPSDLQRKSNVTSMELAYVPFWVVPVEARSRYKGVYERTGSGVVKEGDIERKYEWLVLGRKATDFPAREYEIPLEGKIPYDFTRIDAGAKALNSEVDEAEAVEIAKQQIRALHEYLAKQDVDRIVSMDTDYSTGDAVYIHVPLWFTEYEYKGNRYKVLVDGVTGEVVKGDIPEASGGFSLF